jgi:hypothetical protein
MSSVASQPGHESLPLLGPPSTLMLVIDVLVP